MVCDRVIDNLKQILQRIQSPSPSTRKTIQRHRTEPHTTEHTHTYLSKKTPLCFWRFWQPESQGMRSLCFLSSRFPTTFIFPFKTKTRHHQEKTFMVLWPVGFGNSGTKVAWSRRRVGTRAPGNQERRAPPRPPARHPRSKPRVRAPSPGTRWWLESAGQRPPSSARAARAVAASRRRPRPARRLGTG